MEPKGTPRLGREDWLEAGLRVLWLQGPDAIRAMTLAKKLGVTTGSFYWHFADISDFKHMLLKEWEVKLTDDVIKYFMRMEAPALKKLRAISFKAFEEKLGLYDGAIVAWASTEPEAHKIAQRVQSKRQAYIASLFREAGFKQGEANVRARLFLAYHVGENVNQLRKRKNWRKFAQMAVEIVCR